MDNDLQLKTVQILKSFENLSHDITILYEDFQSETRRLCLEQKKVLELENWWSYTWFDKKLQFIYQYHYRVGKVVKGLSIIASIHDDWLKTPDDYYKMCRDLNVDSKYPLLLIYGVFEPIDITQYHAKDWVLLFTGAHNWSKCQLPEAYEFNKTKEIITNIDAQSPGWFKKGQIKIKPLLDIKGQRDVTSVAEELLNM